MDSKTDHVKAASLKLGPKGLGDPDDLSLRRIEKVVKIPQKMRENARLYKCNEEVKKFDECCLEHGLALIYKCQGPSTALKECIARCFLDEDFRKECTKEYLEERSHYRRTGIPTKRYYRIPDVENQ